MRQEEDRIKVIFLDEINATNPTVLKRLNEVLDAVDKNGTVVLSEDASETVKVSKEKTKVIGLMNPPKEGYLGVSPLSKELIRRWIYLKEPSELPKESFEVRLAADIGRDDMLKEMPGMREVAELYKEFHYSAKNMLKERKIAEDQPQQFLYDDNEERKRFLLYIKMFYSGDITETAQEALKYIYASRLESDEDKKKLEELISHVQYIPKAESKRKGLEQKDVKRSEIRESKESLISLSEAREILGKDFLGPESVKNAFGVELESIPPIQFTKEDLERAKELNQQLVLYVDKTKDGKPFTGKELFDLTNNKTSDGKKLFYDTDWYKNEKFFTKETPRVGWKLASKEIIPGSTSKNYLEQTETIISHLKNEVFKDRELPKEYQEAVDEFESKKSDIAKLINSDWKSAADKLGNLQITKLTRESPIESFYRLALNEKTNKERLLDNRYTWTLGCYSDGKFVNVGNFDDDGASVRGDAPGSRGDRLGVSFSRSL